VAVHVAVCVAVQNVAGAKSIFTVAIIDFVTLISVTATTSDYCKVKSINR
jgi:hypothetical protein